MRWQGLVLIARALMFRIADAGKTIHSILLKRSPPTNTFIASKESIVRQRTDLGAGVVILFSQ